MANAKQYIASCRFCHPQLGVVHVKNHGGATHIRARWQGPELLVTVPTNTLLSEFEAFLDDFREIILQNKPRSTNIAEQIIDGHFADFEIRYCDFGDSKIGGRYEVANPVRGKKANCIIEIDRSAITDDTDDNWSVRMAVNDILLEMAKRTTVEYILPHAYKLAASVGATPAGWKVKMSKRSLGSCSSERIITLSPKLIFLPEDLLDYIIFHELSHLTEMNHSAAFHRLCDRYCQGREAEYSDRIDAFRFPIF